jgi:hypothetical protein
MHEEDKQRFAVRAIKKVGLDGRSDELRSETLTPIYTDDTDFKNKILTIGICAN